MKEKILLAKWSLDKLDRLLNESYRLYTPSRRIDFLSRKFLYTPYKEFTLIGDSNNPEIFVIDLKGVDCFTYIDYIEAMQLSKSFDSFRENLKKIRYQSGEVSFVKRNHFFSDWQEFNRNLFDNITESICKGKTRKIIKVMNKKNNGYYFIPGVPCRNREIVYIPSEDVDEEINKKLRTGDFVGIYSDKTGLDVSHVGIVIKEGSSVFFRHASSSSKHRLVIDENFKYYLKDKPGIIILRPKNILPA